MKWVTILSCIILTAFFAISQSHYIEIPSDLRYPCHSYYQESLDFPYTPEVDGRMKRQQKPSLVERINTVKKECAADWGIPKDKIPKNLLKLKTATPTEKCLMACVLQRMDMMTCDNLVSIDAVEKLANEVSKGNPLVTSVAKALAEKYNKSLAALNITDQCEVGFLINHYLGKEMFERRIVIPN